MSLMKMMDVMVLIPNISPPLQAGNIRYQAFCLQQRAIHQLGLRLRLRLVIPIGGGA